jgi:hypothetical protein
MDVLIHCLSICCGGIDPIQALNDAAVINAVVGFPKLIALMKITN